MKIGALGTHTRGKISEDDEGDLMMAVSHEPNIVRMDFGKPVIWLGLEPDIARQLGKMLIEHADKASPQ